MVGVNDDQRPQPRSPQPIEQRGVDARRNRDRPTRVDAQAAQVRDRGELRLQRGEGVVVERQRIAAREDHLVNRRIGAHVVDRALERLVAQRVLAVGEVTAKAVAAVHRAGAGHDQQHAALVLVEQPRHRRRLRFGQRIDGPARPPGGSRRRPARTAAAGGRWHRRAASAPPARAARGAGIAAPRPTRARRSRGLRRSPRARPVAAASSRGSRIIGVHCYEDGAGASCYPLL